MLCLHLLDISLTSIKVHVVPDALIPKTAFAIRPEPDVAVVSKPKFLCEGAPIQDFKHLDRIVMYTDDERAL